MANNKQLFAVKLLANSEVVQQELHYFEHTKRFPISHFTYHLRYYIIIDRC